MAFLNKGLNPHVLAVLPGIIPSTALTVIKPLLGLEAKGLIHSNFLLEWFLNQSELEKAELLVFSRNIEPNYSQAFSWALSHRIPYIYDIDDNFFELPRETEEFEYYNSPERQNLLKEYIKSAALVRVYSRPMFERVSTLTKSVVRIPAPIDLSLVQKSKNKSSGPLKIVYATSRKVDPLYPIFWPALQRILIDYEGKVEVHFWGFFNNQFKGMKGIHYHAPTANYDHFLRSFSQSGFSIGLAPMLDTNFYQSKTNNKFREYGACRIAGIYSDVEIYRDCVQDGETGLLVDNYEDGWYQAIARLIEEPGLRIRTQDQAEKVVREQYSEENFELTWIEQIQRIVQSDNKFSLQNVAIEDQDHLSEFARPKVRQGIVSLVIYQMGKIIRILKEDGLASFLERMRFKVEQLTLLFEIKLMRRF